MQTATEHTRVTSRAPRQSLPLDQRTSYTVSEYCALHGFGRTTLYKMWKNGTGPEFFVVGTHRRIPHGSLPKGAQVTVSSTIGQEASHD